MINFNELKITPDGKSLIIDVSVRNESYYKNVYIGEVIIDNQDTYKASGPSSTPIYRQEVEPNKKHIRLDLSKLELGNPVGNPMLFVYITTTGTPAPDTPCNLDNYVSMRTVVNLYPMYQQSINYLACMNNDCDIPKKFVDMILRFKALELCIKTGNYIQAIKYWNRFFMNIKPGVSNTNCNCRNG